MCLLVGKTICIAPSVSMRNTKTVIMFDVERPDLGSVVVGVQYFMRRAMNILSAFRSLALFSLPVDSTEKRLVRSHLELFSREHMWGPWATIPSFLVALPGSSLIWESISA